MRLVDLAGVEETLPLPTNKEKLREKISRDVQTYIDAGGSIEKVGVRYRDFVPRFVVNNQL